MKSAVDGVSCESKCIQETIQKFLRGQFQHVGVADKNHNVKNNQYYNLGGSCAAVMEGYLFVPVMFHLLGVTHKMCLP